MKASRFKDTHTSKVLYSIYLNCSIACFKVEEIAHECMVCGILTVGYTIGFKMHLLHSTSFINFRVLRIKRGVTYAQRKISEGAEL